MKVSELYRQLEAMGILPEDEVVIGQPLHGRSYSMMNREPSPQLKGDCSIQPRNGTGMIVIL